MQNLCGYSFSVATKHQYIRDANINIQKLGRIHTKSKEVFNITSNFNGTKLARNREVAKFGCQNGQKCFKNREPPSEIGRVGISDITITHEFITSQFARR